MRFRRERHGCCGPGPRRVAERFSSRSAGGPSLFAGNGQDTAQILFRLVVGEGHRQICQEAQGGCSVGPQAQGQFVTGKHASGLLNPLFLLDESLVPAVAKALSMVGHNTKNLAEAIGEKGVKDPEIIE